MKFMYLIHHFSSIYYREMMLWRVYI